MNSRDTLSIPWWVTIVIVIVAVLAFAHARRYFRALRISDTSDITILQASLEDASSDLLGEWKPIVIQDRLVDPVNALTSTLLRWQYVWKSNVQPLEDGRSYRSLCRFTVIFPSSEYETRILLSRKEEEEEDVVEIVLSMGRCIILPPGFTYSVKKGEFQASQVRLHDSVTALLSRFVR
jgi:hypothetical protein